MNKLLSYIKKDFKTTLSSPVYILIMFLTPIIITSITGFVFAPKEGMKIEIRMGIINNDSNDFFKILFTKALDNKEMKKKINIKTISLINNKKNNIMKDNNLSAILVIPKDSTKNFFNRKKINFHIIKNPKEQFKPFICSEFVKTSIVLLNSFSSIFSEELSLLKGKDKVNIKDILIYMNDKKMFSSISEKIKSSISQIPLNFKFKGKEKKRKDLSGMYKTMFPATLILFILFLAESFTRSIQDEIDNNVVSRIFSSYGTINTFLFSRYLLISFFIFLSFIFTLGTGSLIFGIVWVNILNTISFIFVFSFIISGFWIFFISIFKNRRQAEIFSAPVILIMSLVGGSMIPSAKFPPFLQYFSRFTINYRFISFFSETQKSGLSFNNFLILIVINILILLLAFSLFKRRVIK